ncbi:AAA family ATPase [Sphingobacterium sp. IITKGP-BTPF85]|uniref:AAA family ATPase n=1 Tax=Sphingobacterium sp. IITKGP-BTPF85 TaxID=1338009 RepID=UPI00038A3C0B|nr:AAA family ATPase [Sphingobacterium sp. IITKGP-BTPF85]KKX47650.1 hypothetical protein L950_0225385 [Sphingobacterium sp. IITKGP-BTPF85]
MNKIRVKNFGPIQNGIENNGFLDINKITIFIGNEGSGKECMAKLISTMSWLEKTLFRGEIKESYVTSYNRFVKEYCNYQNLANYFSDDTEIDFVGEVYDMKFREGKLTLSAKNAESYKVPKIMYVPAERNFLSAVENPDKLKGLPKSLSKFWEEMQKALRELSGSIKLPIGDVRFEYDKANKIPRIVGKSYRLRLSEASSGFQSFVPLYLVSHNLATSIEKERDTSRNELSAEAQRKLQNEIAKIISNEKLSTELREAALKLLSSKYRNDTFLNIVEEIEQNLFPSSQMSVLFTLLEYANLHEENGLILTTHSPYIINYLTLSIQAEHLHNRIANSNNNDKEGLSERLNDIVPLKSCIKGTTVTVYQLEDNGKIVKLPDYEGLPSDQNYLNIFLEKGNRLFDSLLEIEGELI